METIKEYCEKVTRNIVNNNLHTPLWKVLEHIGNIANDTQVELFAGVFKVYTNKPCSALKTYDKLYMTDRDVLSLYINGIGMTDNGIVQIMI